MKKTIFIFLFALIFIIPSKYSFAQAGKNIRMLGRVDPVNNPQAINYSAIWGYEANGREYAILCGVFATYFVDVTDSTKFVICGQITSGGTSNREVKTYSHFAYVVSEAQNSLIQIVDLQNLPNSINYLGNYALPNHSTTHTISQSGPYLFLNGCNAELTSGIAVLDLSINPAQPVLRGKWNSLYVHDCRILRDTIWASNIYDGKMSVIDARNKDSLKTIKQWDNLPYPYPHNSAVTNDRHYAFTTDETSSPPGKLKVWDVSDLENVTLLNIITPPLFENTVIHNVELYGNLLIDAHYEAGVRLYDISNPPVPVNIGWFDTYPVNNSSGYGGCWGAYKFSSGKIIASDRYFGLFILRYDPPRSERPKAEFMASKPSALSGDSIRLIDCSTNTPSGFAWTIIGPQKFSSTLPNPIFRFTELGQYSVNLRVTNSFGVDSLVKTNYIRINGSTLISFTISGQSSYTIITGGSDTSRVRFSWKNASPNGISITYKFRFRKIGSSNDYYFLSDNNGADTNLNIRKSVLDSLSRQAGLNGDSVIMNCRVVAYNGTDSLFSSNAIIVIIKSTSVDITNLSTTVPDKFYLKRNYPNPFNPTTAIEFGMPVRSKVSLTIFDISGRKVAIAFEGMLNGGKYIYRFDAAGFSSGVYFYVLKGDGIVFSERMILLK